VPLSKEYKKLIFGIKLKQYRSAKKFSLQSLSKQSGISVSYLNEIEKGKKYPKEEKIIALSKCLEVPFKELTSEHLGNTLAPVSELLQSGILSELPLELFGLELSRLMDLLSNAPTKLNAFIGTLLEVSRNYDLRVETFYFSVLRSYQEIHNNFFEDLEKSVESFIELHQIDTSVPITTKQLEQLLKSQYNYTLKYDSFESHESLNDLRTLMLPKKKPKLLLNTKLNSRQRAFNLAKELGFKYLKLKERPYASPWVEITAFDQVLNNFKASYFATALLINRKSFLKDLKLFFEKDKWDSDILINTMSDYNATPEMVLQRMTNLLPKYFGLKELFFFRFNNIPFSDIFRLSKELHLSRKHSPRGTVLQEHFCRRWMFISILNDLAKLHKNTGKLEEIGGAQIDKYHETGEEFLVLSMARPLYPTPGVNSSLSLGIRLDENAREKIKFLADPLIQTKIVNDTCERCNAQNCKERVAPPYVYNALKQEKERREAVKKIK
jgi:transcriptional regulator with XRE-family HTH domain